jgi:hypothetical protein
MVRDGSKNGISLKAGLHARTAHTILPPPPDGHVREKNGFLTSRSRSLRYRHNRRAKVHPRCLQLRVFVAQMPIHLAD